MLIRILAFLIGLIVLLLVAGWLGLQIRAASFAPVGADGVSELVALPANLPEAVQRYAHAVYGDNLPKVQSAMVLGRAQLAPTGMPMPTRFRFYYDAVRNSYYHDIQVTWFTLPFMRISERNLQGHTTLDLSIIGYVDDKPLTNRAAVQGYWAEVLAWVPAVVLTDTQVRWEAIDTTTARLYLPGLDDVEALTVQFDAETGLLKTVNTMRYQDESRPERWRWYNDVLEWGVVNNQRVPVKSQTRWNDSPPWATWEIEQVVLNKDVSARMNQFGGDA